MSNSHRYQDADVLKQLSLGQATPYVETYQPDLLQPVPRTLNRDDLGLRCDNLPFDGADIWTAYELSWLNRKGKPQVALASFEVPATTPNLIESKSFKLYLNSFNQTRLDSPEQLQERLARDLSGCAGGAVKVTLYSPLHRAPATIGQFEGECIDDLDIEVDDYQFRACHLEGAADPADPVSEVLTSHLLKSNCLVTGQPDWGSIQIRYRGPRINREALLRYLISFRRHNEFHEQCVERIFTDLMHYCRPAGLTVYARYTRRGGLDINPYRSNEAFVPAPVRLVRQ